MATRTYDAKNIVVTVAGIPMQEYADGEFLRLETVSDFYSEIVGSDGVVTRSATNDRRATITVILMQTSPTNDLLSALLNADLLSPNGAGIGSFLCTDLEGTSLFRAENCWIVKPPNVSYGKEASTREWTFRCDQIQFFAGGNV